MIIATLTVAVEFSYGVDFKCTFQSPSGWNHVTGRACRFSNLVVTAPNQVITSVNGQGGSYHHSQNVKAIEIASQTTNFVPQGLEKLFLQVEGVEIINSKLKEILKRDLSPFPLLKELWLS